MPLPRLRVLDAYPVQIDGETRVCVRDPENIQEEVLLMSPAAFVLASMLDGENDITDLQAMWARNFNGQILPSEDVKRLVDELDQKLLLYTERYEKKKKAIEKDFTERGSRPAYLANRSYPAAPEELRKMLDGFFTAEGGPGALPEARRGSGMTGLIAPHIDYHRGGPAYAHAYKKLVEECDAELFVVLGVAHASPPSPYVLCEKDFETPFGVLPADREFLKRLTGRLKKDYYAYQLCHRTEHSIELQAVYLKYLADRAIEIVPVLCSSFEALYEGKDPESVGEIQEFIQAVRETIRESGKKTCILSGADLAHVGPRFGDPFPVGPSLISWMSAEDRVSLDLVQKCDARGFYQSVVADGNKRKVCGLASIYTALRLLEGSRGELLTYGYAPDPAGGIVSFASVSFRNAS